MNTENAVLALDRIEQKFERLRERLAAVEAERQRLQADLATQKCREEDMVNTLRQERAGYQNRVEQLEAELDTAQAGEARALEALRTIRGEDIYPDADGMIEDATCLYCYGNSINGCDEDCPRFIAANVIDSAQPALGWLAQQRREAAAEWIEKNATESGHRMGEYYERRVEGMLEEAAALRAGEAGNE